MRRCLTTSICCLGALAALSPAAMADSTVGRDGPDLVANTDILYDGNVAAGDDIDVYMSGGDLMFRDLSNLIDAGPGCTNDDPHTVRCDTANLTRFRVRAFDGENVVEVQNDGGVDNRLDGGDQKDVLIGDDATDVIKAGNGDDFVYGGNNPAGPPQLLRGEDGKDFIRGGSGRDDIRGEDGDDGLQPLAGVDLISGGNHRDRVYYSTAPSYVHVSLDGVQNDGTNGELDNVSTDVEDLNGSNWSDTLDGSHKENDILGLGGNDVITGSADDDHLHGGDDIDTLYGQTGVDVLNGGSEHDILKGGSDVDALFGEGGPDNLDGGPANDLLDGAAGADKLKGGDGEHDTVSYMYRASGVKATIGAGGAGEPGEDDTIDADVEGILGGSGDDELNGNGAANSLSGGPGGDTLVGGGGLDSLFGGAGSDSLDSSGDGAGDTDQCGDGDDSVRADQQDNIAECEQVELVSVEGPGGGTPGGEAPGGGQAAGPKVAISKRTVTVGSSRVAAVKLTCPKSAKVRCVGSLTLSRAKSKLGKKGFSIVPGKSARVKVKVKLAGTSLAAARKRSGLKVRAVAVATDGGSQSATSKRTLRLKRKR